MGLILARPNVRYTLTGKRKSTTESKMFLTDANLLFMSKAFSRSFRSSAVQIPQRIEQTNAGAARHRSQTRSPSCAG